MLVLIEGFSLTLGAILNTMFNFHQSMSSRPGFGILTILSKLALYSLNDPVWNLSSAL